MSSVPSGDPVSCVISEDSSNKVPISAATTPTQCRRCGRSLKKSSPKMTAHTGIV
jgi:hypothetical protein